MTVRSLEMGAFIRNDHISDSIAQVYDLFPILKQKSKLLVNSRAASANRSQWQSIDDPSESAHA